MSRIKITLTRARVLGRIYDAIEYRGFEQAIVQELADFSGVPVYNELIDEFHPTQVLADFLTMMEHVEKPLHKVSFVFLGDAGNNMGDSLMISAAKMGMDVRLCAPTACWPSAEIQQETRDIALTTDVQITITKDVNAAVNNVDFIYSDVWVSMDDRHDKWAERIKLLTPYQVTSAVMASTGNPRTKLMHCLPAFHNTNTTVGTEMKEEFGIECMEVTDEVFESEASIVFDQAENRMRTIKAVLVATLGSWVLVVVHLVATRYYVAESR